jgi:hypothetical protein
LTQSHSVGSTSLQKKLKGFSSNDVTHRLKKHDGHGPPNRHHMMSVRTHEDVSKTIWTEV